MKAMKKLFALLLALTMVFGLAATGFAAETGKITIDDAVPGVSYSIYRIFDLESYNAETNSYSYKVNSAWAAYFADGAEGLNYVTIKDGYVTWKEDADVVAFAKAAQAFATATATKINPVETKVAGAAADGEEYTSVEFSPIELGYYLVDTTLGSLCSLDTMNPNAVIKEKNEKPDIEKEVKEGDKWGESNTAGIGDTVEFHANITAYEGAQKYIMHDTMTDGLDFDATSVSVTCNGTAVDPANYDVKTTDLGDSCTFHVEFHQNYLDTLTDNNPQTTLAYNIVVSYEATVTAAAKIGTDENTNTVKLDYGDNHDTEEDTTTTYVYELNVYKYFEQGDEKVHAPLAGAKFVLYKNIGTDADPVYKYATVDAATHKLTGWVDAEADATQLETFADGLIQIEGLDAGDYILKETKAPDGYNILKDVINITIDQEGKVAGAVEIEIGDTKYPNTYEVLNQSGTELPSTGGMGTTLFYVLGSIMVIGAAVILVSKKRVNQ